MNRRGPGHDARHSVDEKFSRPDVRTVSVVALVATLLIAVGATTVAASAPFAHRAATVDAPDDTTPETVPPETVLPETVLPETVLPEITRPPISANEFIPEDRDLTSCIGALERPGCGSESRGGWRQTLVFSALLVGLVVVFGNVVRGVRKRDR